MRGNSRRNFLKGAAVAALSVATPGGAALARSAALDLVLSGAAVGAVFNEQFYVDRSGRVDGYRPPLGARGLAATAHLDETQFRMAHPYA